SPCLSIFLFVVLCLLSSFFLFFFIDPPTTELYTLSLHDALPISAPEAGRRPGVGGVRRPRAGAGRGRLHRDARRFPAPVEGALRSEEHTSELQSRFDLVCRLLLEKKKKKTTSCNQQMTQVYKVI